MRVAANAVASALTRIRLRDVLCLMVGFVSSMMCVTVLEPSGEVDCYVDYEDEPGASWVTAPVRAWRRRSRALEEVSENTWQVIQDPEFAHAAYMQKTAPVRALAGFATTVAGIVISNSIRNRIAQ